MTTRRPAERREPVAIRDARPTDLDALVRLWTEFVSYHERVGRARLAPQGAELRVREAFHSDLTDRSACVLVAEFRGQVVGYALARLHPIPPTYEGQRLGVVHELVVTERSRLHGIGRRLVLALLDWFRRKRADRIEVTVLSENEDARLFWERIGFRLSGVRFERKLHPPQNR